MTADERLAVVLAEAALDVGLFERALREGHSVDLWLEFARAVEGRLTAEGRAGLTAVSHGMASHDCPPFSSASLLDPKSLAAILGKDEADQ